MTTTVSFDFDASAFGALRLAPREFAHAMRLAAVVQWYAQGIVSQCKAAELAGLTRRAHSSKNYFDARFPPVRSNPMSLRTRSMAHRRWIINASA